MSVREIFSQESAAINMADNPEGLWALHKQDCAAVIWHRRPLPCFQSWIDAIEPEQLPSARVTLRAENVCEVTRQICEAAGTPDCKERDRLIEDTAALAHLFTELLSTPYLLLRFDVVTDNACRKFHTDTVTARLVCTYRGTGTQYGISTDHNTPSRIFTVPTGTPILLRGKLWPEQPRSGLLHRSPPIEHTRETRLVLVLDPMDDPNGLPKRQRLH